MSFKAFNSLFEDFTICNLVQCAQPHKVESVFGSAKTGLSEYFSKPRASNGRGTRGFTFYLNILLTVENEIKSTL